MPRTITELGMTYFQVVHRVPGRLLWIDEEGLKTDFPQLQSLSRRELEALILLNFSVVTDLQAGLRGTVISNFRLPKAPSRVVYHPQRYLRAGVAEFEIPTRPGQPIGLMDLKGIGYSPEGRDRVDDFFGQIQNLTGEHPITSKDLEFVQARLASAQRDLEPVRAQSLDQMSPKQRRNHVHGLSVDEKTLQIYTFLSHIFEVCLKENRHATPTEVQHYIELLGSRDYTNGVIGSGRLLKEIMVQTRVDYARVTSASGGFSGRRVDTIHSYFLIELPIRVRTPSGIQNMGILGRQPHWRFQNIRDVTIPDDMGVNDFLGAQQFSALGQWVDFENVELLGDPVFGLRDGFSTQLIDELSDRATLGWGFFKKRKIARLFRRVFSDIPRPPSTDQNFLEDGQWMERFIADVRAMTKEPDALVAKYLPFARTHPGLFMAMQLLLVSHHPNLVATFLTKLVEDTNPVEYRPTIFLEVLLPLFQTRPQLAGEIFTKYRQATTREEHAPVLGRLGLELTRREAFVRGILIPRFWMGYGSISYMIGMLWLIESLEGKPEPEIKEVVEAMAQLTPVESTVQKLLEDILEILRGTKDMANLSSVQLQHPHISMKSFNGCVGL